MKGKLWVLLFYAVLVMGTTLAACDQMATLTPTGLHETDTGPAMEEVVHLSPTDPVPDITLVVVTEEPSPIFTPTPTATPNEDAMSFPSVSPSTVPSGLSAAGWCDPALEQEALEAINQRRTETGAPPLAMHVLLVDAARRHSQDMALNNIFSHTGSDGSSPFERMQEAGYTYTAAAENLGVGYSSGLDAVSAWMDSSGHRENMLNPVYIHAGIACHFNPQDPHGFTWTAVFAAP